MAKRKKIKVTGLELETKGGAKVPLTLEEAKELYDQLHDLFGKETEIRHQWHYWRPWWDRPYVTYTTGASLTTGNLQASSYTALSNTTGMKLTYNSTDSSATKEERDLKE